MSKDFIKDLQKEARIQSSLQEEKLIPDFLSELSSLIAQYTWQFLLGISFLLAVIWQFLWQAS